MLIGMIGHARSGKDTVAEYMSRWYGFQKYALAEPLKRACRDIFDLSDEQVEGREKDAFDPALGTSPRALMQFVGTDLFREALGHRFPNIGPYVWVDRMERFLRTKGDQNWVVTDVRFENEAQRIRSLGGVIVRVHHPATIEACDHVSEREQERIHAEYTIHNTGDLEYLCSQVHTMMISPSVRGRA